MADHAFQLQQLLLGSLEARLAGSPLVFPTCKTLALLTYLALAEGPQPREHLAAPPWPDGSPERSHPSPRNTLGHPQRPLCQASDQAQSAIIVVTSTMLGLNPEAGLELDLRTVERAYALARADRSSRAPAAGSAGQAPGIPAHHGRPGGSGARPGRDPTAGQHGRHGE